jgi:hypothetical protein
VAPFGQLLPCTAPARSGRACPRSLVVCPLTGSSLDQGESRSDEDANGNDSGLGFGQERGEFAEHGVFTFERVMDLAGVAG